MITLTTHELLDLPLGEHKVRIAITDVRGIGRAGGEATLTKFTEDQEDRYGIKIDLLDPDLNDMVFTPRCVFNDRLNGYINDEYGEIHAEIMMDAKQLKREGFLLTTSDSYFDDEFATEDALKDAIADLPWDPDGDNSVTVESIIGPDGTEYDFDRRVVIDLKPKK